MISSYISIDSKKSTYRVKTQVMYDSIFVTLRLAISLLIYSFVSVYIYLYLSIDLDIINHEYVHVAVSSDSTRQEIALQRS